MLREMQPAGIVCHVCLAILSVHLMLLFVNDDAFRSFYLQSCRCVPLWLCRWFGLYIHARKF